MTPVLIIREFLELQQTSCSRGILQKMAEKLISTSQGNFWFVTKKLSETRQESL